MVMICATVDVSFRRMKAMLPVVDQDGSHSLEARGAGSGPNAGWLPRPDAQDCITHCICKAQPPLLLGP